MNTIPFRKHSEHMKDNLSETSTESGEYHDTRVMLANKEYE